MEVSNILSLLSGPVLGAVALFMIIIFGIVIISIIRGMLNIFFTTLLILSLLLTLECFYAYYFTGEMQLKENFEHIIRDGDEKLILEFLSAAFIGQIEKNYTGIKLTESMKNNLISGISESDPKKIRLVAGQIFVHQVNDIISDKLSEIGLEKVELSESAIDRIAEAIYSDRDNSEVREIILEEVVESSPEIEDKDKTALRTSLRDIYEKYLTDEKIEKLRSTAKDFNPDLVLNKTDTLKNKIISFKDGIKRDFHRKYTTTSVSLRGLSPKSADLRVFYILGVPIFSSPLVFPVVVVKKEITAEELHSLMKKMLIVLILIDFALIAALFLINLGFAGALSHLGMALIISGILFFILMILGRNMTEILMPNGPLFSKINVKEMSATEASLIVEIFKRYGQRVAEVLVSGLERRKTGSVISVILGAIIFAQSKFNLIPIGRKKRES